MSQSPPSMKQARRLPLLALDLALLFALFGCAAPGPTASAGRFSAPAYVASPEFAGLVPLTSRADEFCGLLPLTPSAGAMQLAFESFCDSCDWWLDRISEFSAPEPEIPPLMIRP